ncbi:MAG TPA: gephyrin-like molybdotransferase Glp [Anaerolineaceae bacterium]|nr:gephyrin-like molybdotransferase Glp [Anaerolineaceae bacterium]
MNKLLSVEEARNRILAAFKQKNCKTIPLEKSLHQFLFSDITAKIDLPSFDNSSMDGFAVIIDDLIELSEINPIELEIIEDIAAGYTPKKVLQNGQAARIMTGAPLPLGADSVVPVELTNFSDRYAEEKLPEKIQVMKFVKKGENIRPQGQDIKQGELIFSKGHKLRPQDLGFLAAQGIDKVDVVQKPTVALLSSGDELLKPGENLVPGKIYDSNSITIKIMLESFGAEVIDLGVAKDNYQDIKSKLDSVIKSEVDMIVTTAGVSVGVYDYIREVILQEGNLNFWKVNIRPGKPLTFGDYKNIPFLGLPGNPVSAFVSTLIFIRPIINKMLGNFETTISDQAIILEDITSDGRESYLRAEINNIEGKFFAKLTSHQGSGNIFSLVCANALLIIPAGVKSVPKGKAVNFYWI